jgi:hypothetical protein
MLDDALMYGELGLPMFAVAPNCRTPLVHKGRFEHGCHDATTDADEIRWRWTVAHPGANMAVATGDRCGAFVLDVDCKGEVDGFKVLAWLEEKKGPLPATWTASTPSGGRHFWFRKTAEVAPINNVGLRLYRPDGTFKKLAGLDIRTTGGSVCVAPSAKPNGPYQWLHAPWAADLADPPAWLVKLIDAPPPPPASSLAPVRLDTSERAARYVAAAVNGECGDLAKMGPGSGRNLRLFQAAANLGGLVGARLLTERVAQEVLEKAADDCGLWKEDGPHAVRATIKSGMNRGLASPREVAL